MPIWKTPLCLADLTALNQGTAAAHLGMEMLEIGDDFLRARLPVDERCASRTAAPKPATVPATATAEGPPPLA
jgi:hypothetical protein